MSAPPPINGTVSVASIADMLIRQVGYQARLAGDDETACPYKSLAENRLWLEGWMEADRMIVR